MVGVNLTGGIPFEEGVERLGLLGKTAYNIHQWSHLCVKGLVPFVATCVLVFVVDLIGILLLLESVMVRQILSFA